VAHLICMFCRTWPSFIDTIYMISWACIPHKNSSTCLSRQPGGRGDGIEASSRHRYVSRWQVIHLVPYGRDDPYLAPLMIRVSTKSAIPLMSLISKHGT
jgi:hypothetical protein